MPATPIVLGSQEGQRLAIAVKRRSEAADEWGGSWVVATIRAHAGAFRGEYEALLGMDELAAFRARLATLYEDLKGEATFESMEQWLWVRVVGDGRGHFVARCEARDEPGEGNELRFELAFDQSEVPAMLAALDAVLTEFPVRGGSG